MTNSKIYTNIAGCFLLLSVLFPIGVSAQTGKPNILFCIADDASFQHFSAYKKTGWVKTPNFDRVAAQGLLFTKAYTPNAKCSPSRASILTGRNPWQLEEAGNHNPYFPAKFASVFEVLKSNSYFTGFTGKGWGPGVPGKVNGVDRQLTGKNYSQLKKETPTKQISGVDYAANFKQFLAEKPKDQPFCFWFGSHEPHRGYEFGSGQKLAGKKTTDIAEVPPFWVDNESTRKDMLDYAYEVEYFDKMLGEVLAVLEKSGQLENTLIVITSDNGMPFPRTKGHTYEYDNHLPLAMMWKGHIKNPGRTVDDFVSFIDFAPTFLELAGLNASKTSMAEITGKSLVPIFNGQSYSRDHVLLGRERQDVGRPMDQGYPVRAIVKGGYIYSINYEPGRWPAGDPETGYMDTDNSPTKSAILEAYKNNPADRSWQLSFGKKGGEELYDINQDPYSVKNLANDPKFAGVKKLLKAQLETELKQQNDPRLSGNGSIFDTYPYAKPAMRGYYEKIKSGQKPKGAKTQNDTDEN